MTRRQMLLTSAAAAVAPKPALEPCNFVRMEAMQAAYAQDVVSLTSSIIANFQFKLEVITPATRQADAPLV